MSRPVQQNNQYIVEILGSRGKISRAIARLNLLQDDVVVSQSIRALLNARYGKEVSHVLTRPYRRTPAPP